MIKVLNDLFFNSFSMDCRIVIFYRQTELFWNFKVMLKALSINWERCDNWYAQVQGNSKKSIEQFFLLLFFFFFCFFTYSDLLTPNILYLKDRLIFNGTSFVFFECDYWFTKKQTNILEIRIIFIIHFTCSILLELKTF